MRAIRARFSISMALNAIRADARTRGKIKPANAIGVDRTSNRKNDTIVFVLMIAANPTIRKKG